MEETTISTIDEAEVIAIADEVTGTTVSEEESAATIMTDAATDTAIDAATTGSMISMLLPFVLVIALMYFIMIRPQRKKEKELKEKLSKLAVGDKVVTIGGICGKIYKIKDEYVIIETGSTGNPNEKSYIRLERTSINTVQSKES